MIFSQKTTIEIRNKRYDALTIAFRLTVSMTNVVITGYIRGVYFYNIIVPVKRAERIYNFMLINQGHNSGRKWIHKLVTNDSSSDL
jgi:hypothetical protein